MSEVNATGMLTLYPGVCCEDILSSRTLFGKYVSYSVGVTLTRSLAWVFLGPQRRTGRWDTRVFLLCGLR